MWNKVRVESEISAGWPHSAQDIHIVKNFLKLLPLRDSTAR